MHIQCHAFIICLTTRRCVLCRSGHFYNGFTWRLKLTVKPPDQGSANDMNIHVGLCWGIEVEGEGPLPLNDGAMVQVRCCVEGDTLSAFEPSTRPGECVQNVYSQM
jgi:hypothetical protein